MQNMDILAYTFEDLKKHIASIGEKEGHAYHLFRYIYHDFIFDFDKMEKLSATLKEHLQKNAFFCKLKLDKKLISNDGTIKYCFILSDNSKIESVIIPQKDGKLCLCVSSQVGCALNCEFCVTGKSSFKRNLRPSEIIAQVLFIVQDVNKKPYSIVFMGMGEPLNNYGNVVKSIKILSNNRGFNFGEKKITVSTAGIIPNITKLCNDTKVKIAISLNATDDNLRNKLMPINKKYSIKQLIECCKALPLSKRKHIMIEYIVFSGLNDSLEDAEKLAALLKDVKATINLIPFNENKFCSYKKPDEKTVTKFKLYLMSKGFKTFIRDSKGLDIYAACGMLGLNND